MTYSGESIYLSSSTYHHQQHWCDDEEHILETIENAKNSDKTYLYLQGHFLTEAICTKLYELISEKSEARGDWTKWVASECQDCILFQQCLAQAVQTFRHVVLADLKPAILEKCKSSSLATSVDAMHTLSVGLCQTSTLTRLEIKEMSLNSDQMGWLARGLTGASTLKSLRFGSVHFIGNPKHLTAKLACGLRANASIQILQLVRCQLEDAQVAQIVDALQHNYSIYELDLSGNNCRSKGFEALSFLLEMDGCVLKILKLNDQFFRKQATGVFPTIKQETKDPRDRSSGFQSTDDKLPFDENRGSNEDGQQDQEGLLPIEKLLPGLQANSSLTHLELSRNELENVNSLLAILWKCPNLTTLDLLGNRITNLQDSLQKACCLWHSPRPSRLRRLELSYNNLFAAHSVPQLREENAKWLYRLVKIHPELEYFAKSYGHRQRQHNTSTARHQYSLHQQEELPRMNTSTSPGISPPQNQANTLNATATWFSDKRGTSFDDKIQHYLDLNKTGRTLVANNAVPLSVWAYVLERANQVLSCSTQRQANAIFHLLQGGPATTPQTSRQ